MTFACALGAASVQFGRVGLAGALAVGAVFVGGAGELREKLVIDQLALLSHRINEFTVVGGEAGAPVFGFVAVEAFDGFGDGFSVPVLGQEVVAWVPGGWECVC